MKQNRRRFLLLTGLTVAGCVGKDIAANPLESSPPTPVPAPDRVKIADFYPAPPGMHAPKRGEVRLAVISDLNGAYGATDYSQEVKRAVELIPAWQPDLVICSGDMVAGQLASLREEQMQAMWAAFDRHIATPLNQAAIPFSFTIGNHDASASINSQGEFRFAKEREVAAAYWNDPARNLRLNFVDRAGFPFYYSFLQNGIFFLSWDASTAKIDPKQIAWVKQSLSSPIAREARLRIVIGHLPLYAVAVGRDSWGNFLTESDTLRSLLEENNVHTYISGHHHAYYPAHLGRLQLLNCGALGNGPRRWLGSPLSPEKTLTLVDIDGEQTRYTTYNMTTLEVFNAQKLPRTITGPSGRILRRDIQATV
ncbi:MAG: metallophosphoesterase [Cyanobacteria bacterium P01_E01_bin.42]